MVIELFWVFLKIGLFTFGGGYAMIAVIENNCVEKKKWINHDEMMDITVIAESTPGPIAINTATHVGYKRAGVMGALAATIGMVLPSFVIIFLISMFLEQFMEFTLIANAFQGIKIGVGLLIFDAGIKMMKKMPGMFGGRRGKRGGFGGFGDFGDIFSDFFGGGATRSARQDAPRRGENVASRLELTFEEAAFGVEKEVSATRIENCAKCSGTGSADGAVESCTRCGGSGQIRTTQNFMGMAMQSTSPCPVCSGRGKVIKTPCTTCKGKGKVRRTQKVKVKVPAGVDEGQMVRVHGQGNVGTNGGPAGDLLVEIILKRHKLFERDGANVLCELPISFTQAALGATIEIPTLDGKMTYDIPEGTQTGTTFRLRDKGIPYVNNRSRRGDQLVTVVVETPTRLNREQKELLRQFEESLGDTPKRKKFFDTIKDLFD